MVALSLARRAAIDRGLAARSCRLAGSTIAGFISQSGVAGPNQWGTMWKGELAQALLTYSRYESVNPVPTAARVNGRITTRQFGRAHSMAISFDKALGIHEQALLLRSKRTEVLANNIANVNTPGFKAREIDFQNVLRQQAGEGNTPNMQRNSPLHFSGAAAPDKVTLSYRQASQASLDGNTVDEQLENAAFARNALDHQASFQFLNGKFSGLMKALRGE
jgi:flagellar basal-body rod protein FlgB